MKISVPQAARADLLYLGGVKVPLDSFNNGRNSNQASREGNSGSSVLVIRAAAGPGELLRGHVHIPSSLITPSLRTRPGAGTGQLERGGCSWVGGQSYTTERGRTC